MTIEDENAAQPKTPGPASVRWTDRKVDEILEQSFPASDSPSWTLGVSIPSQQKEAQTDGAPNNDA